MRTSLLMSVLVVLLAACGSTVDRAFADAVSASGANEIDSMEQYVLHAWSPCQLHVS